MMEQKLLEIEEEYRQKSLEIEERKRKRKEEYRQRNLEREEKYRQKMLEIEESYRKKILEIEEEYRQKELKREEEYRQKELKREEEYRQKELKREEFTDEMIWMITILMKQEEEAKKAEVARKKKEARIKSEIKAKRKEEKARLAEELETKQREEEARIKVESEAKQKEEEAKIAEEEEVRRRTEEERVKLEIEMRQKEVREREELNMGEELEKSKAEIERDEIGVDVNKLRIIEKQEGRYVQELITAIVERRKGPDIGIDGNMIKIEEAGRRLEKKERERWKLRLGKESKRARKRKIKKITRRQRIIRLEKQPDFKNNIGNKRGTNRFKRKKGRVKSEHQCDKIKIKLGFYSSSRHYYRKNFKLGINNIDPGGKLSKEVTLKQYRKQESRDNSIGAKEEDHRGLEERNRGKGDPRLRYVRRCKGKTEITWRIRNTPIISNILSRLVHKEKIYMMCRRVVGRLRVEEGSKRDRFKDNRGFSTT